MGTTQEQVPVSSIVLNPENFRHRSVDSEQDAISALFGDQVKRAEMLELAADITQRGLDPSSLPIVEAVGGYWRVLEGNRRVAVLKVLANPSVLPNIQDVGPTAMKSYRDKFAKLGQVAKLPRNILCVVTDDREFANHLIRLKHTGPNAHKGAGTILWDAEGRARYEMSLQPSMGRKRASNSQASDALQLLDALSVHFAGDTELEDLIDRAKKRGLTTLGRVLIKVENQVRLGVQFDDSGEVRFTVERVALRAAMLKLLTELGTPALNSRSTNKAADVTDYLDKIQSELPTSADRLDAAQAATEPTSATAATKSRRRRRTTTPPMRKPFQGLDLYHATDKTRRLLAEMRELRIDDNTHVLSVCIRTLVDLYTADVMSALKKSEIDSPSKRAKKCLELTEPTNTLRKDRLYPRIWDAFASGIGDLSIDTMNAFMHRATHNPTADTIRVQVSDYQPWLQALDEYVEAELTKQQATKKTR